MAKNEVKITGVKEAQDNLLNEINKAVSSTSFLQEVGTEAADQIRKRTRGRQEEYKQTKLEGSTVGARKRLIARGNAFDSRIVRDETTSNLSMSGQLLDAIKVTVNQAQGIITLFLQPIREPYKEATLKEQVEAKDNIQIKEDLEKIGRKFFFISERLKATLEARIATALRRSLKLFDRIKRRSSKL